MENTRCAIQENIVIIDTPPQSPRPAAQPEAAQPPAAADPLEYPGPSYSPIPVVCNEAIPAEPPGLIDLDTVQHTYKPRVLETSNDIRRRPSVINANSPSFLSLEECRLLQEHYERFRDFGGVVRMSLKVFYPSYTHPVIPMCKDCVRSYCINYSSFLIVDYIFRDDIDRSYRDNYYCALCSKPLFTLISAD